jgi:hypothetical protein
MYHIEMLLLCASLFFLASSLTPEQSRDISIRVWRNECAGTIEGLLSWNEGEEFASLGIGHFIWYPSGKRGPFVETFPKLIQFLQKRGIEIPRWLEHARACPWKTREEFRRAKQSPKMNDLRRILKETIPLQGAFLADRLEEALPTLLLNAPTARKSKILARYEQLAALPNGLYALLDYVNFKGYGTAEEERYAGWGWGLFQVLNNMNDDCPPEQVVDEFIRSAKELLEHRVANAPLFRNEQRYLKGWFNRLDSYR